MDAHRSEAHRGRGGRPARPHVRSSIPHRSVGRTGHRIVIERPGSPSRMTPIQREGTPSMDPRTAASQPSDPEAVEFIRFCYQRRRVGWPELYDEMCAVAARGLYRGYGSDDLAGFGVGFSLFEMPSLAAMSAQVIAEEQARRRPVSVAIRAGRPGWCRRPQSPKRWSTCQSRRSSWRCRSHRPRSWCRCVPRPCRS